MKITRRIFLKNTAALIVGPAIIKHTMPLAPWLTESPGGIITGVDFGSDDRTVFCYSFVDEWFIFNEESIKIAYFNEEEYKARWDQVWVNQQPEGITSYEKHT